MLNRRRRRSIDGRWVGYCLVDRKDLAQTRKAAQTPLARLCIRLQSCLLIETGCELLHLANKRGPD